MIFALAARQAIQLLVLKDCDFGATMYFRRKATLVARRCDHKSSAGWR
jgi:hypothetical protein